MNVLSQTTSQVPVWQGCIGLKFDSASRLLWLIFFVFFSFPTVRCWNTISQSTTVRPRLRLSTRFPI